MAQASLSLKNLYKLNSNFTAFNTLPYSVVKCEPQLLGPVWFYQSGGIIIIQVATATTNEVSSDTCGWSPGDLIISFNIKSEIQPLPGAVVPLGAATAAAHEPCAVHNVIKSSPRQLGE